MDKVTPTSLINRLKAQPKEVIETLLRAVPLEVLVNPQTRVADLAFGGGDYLAAVLKLRLEAGVDREVAVATLYGFESSIMHLNYARRKMDLRGVNLTILKPCDLEDLDMKFDVIIGNPPYQDSSNKLKAVKLWPRFITTSLDLLSEGGYLSFVTPSSWMTSRTGNGKRIRQALTEHFNLQTVDESVDTYFNVGVDICGWSGKKEPYSGLTAVNGRPYDLRNVYETDSEAKLYEIFSKVLREDIPKLPLVMGNKQLKKPQLKDDGKYEVHFSGPKVRRTDTELNDAGVPKFVAPWSCSYKSVFFTDKPVGIFNCWFPCTSEEFDDYKQIWGLKIVRLLCEKYKKTCGFTPAVEYGLIPDFRGLSDQDVYTMVGLTEDEIALVESLVK
jgi:hypothetical protein